MDKGKSRAALGVFLFFITAVYLVFCGFAAARFPKNTSVDGLDVSGMTVPAAMAGLREKLAGELSEKRFTIRAGGRVYEFRYPEIYYETNVREVLRAARFGGDFALKKRIRMTKIDDTLRGICDDFYQSGQDAAAIFQPQEREPFRFERERCGSFLNGAALKEEVEKALESGVWEVYAAPQTVRPRYTETEARRSASLLASFTTYFNGDNQTRSHNIALAAQKLNGAVIGVGETFSFNKQVGPRTPKNGFKKAPIISGGTFVEGFGGGVCQASTTVYNAALTAGLTPVEFHPHSLAVGYVEPSFDAMVSGSNCDLKLKNELKGKVYLVCRTGEGWINVRLYGQYSPVTYSRVSVVTENVLPPEPEIREGAEEKEIRAAKNGVKSVGYLVRHEAGKADKRIRIRKDSYAAVQGILQKPPQVQPSPQETQPLSPQQNVPSPQKDKAVFSLSGFKCSVESIFIIK